VAVLMRALDRRDKTKRWEPEAEGMGQGAPESAQITLGIKWDDFLLLSEIRRGPDFLSTGELRHAAQTLGNRGYLSEVFEVELIQRFAEPVFLLPLSIFVIIIGWRFRSLRRPRYLKVPMLGILPVVFAGFTRFYRGCLDNAGIWAVVTLGFSSAVMLFASCALALLILALVILAAQHG
jgi:lipopolysaccharide export LptBFGC system permease protein LptF